MLTTEQLSTLKRLANKHHVKKLLLYRSSSKGSFGPSDHIRLAAGFNSLPTIQYGENFLSFGFAIEDALARKSDLIDIATVKNEQFLKLIDQTKYVVL